MTLQVTLDEKKISPMQLQELLTLIDSLGGTTFERRQPDLDVCLLSKDKCY